MKKLYAFILFYVFLAFSGAGVCTAQYLQRVDSLMQELHNTSNDSVRCIIFRQLSDDAENVNITRSLKFALEAQRYAERSGNVHLMQKTLSDLGGIYQKYGDIKKAITCLLKSINLTEKTKDEINKGIALQSLANVLASEDRLKEAIVYFKQAFEIFENRNENRKAYSALYGLYDAYYACGDEKNYRIYLNKAYKWAKENNIEYGEADYMQQRGLEELDNENYREALNYFGKALAYFSQENDVESISYLCANLGDCYLNIGDYDNAKKYYYKSYLIAKQAALISPAKNASAGLGALCYRQKKYFNAYQYLTEHILLKDSVNSQRGTQELVDIKNGYNRELKQKELEAAQLIELESKEEQKRDNIIFAIISGVLLLITYMLFSRYRFKVRSSDKLSEINRELNQQNEEIASQRDEIEKQKIILDNKNTEITNSIIYAKHLQDDILPEETFMQTLFRDFFILFKPKDIVSGDFYWCDRQSDDIYIAVADCTGHGVPGAFMSIVNYNLLNHALHEHKKTSPAEILSQVNTDLSQTLRQSIQESTVRDGMDISLVKVTGRKLTFSGANNSIYIKRVNTGRLEEIKADKQSIGSYMDEETAAFTNKEIDLETGDIIYMFTDGYPDQFGGINGKKFKYRQLENLLGEISSQNMKTQSEILDRSFESWKGTLEQIDDVTIIGLKIE